MNVEQIATHMAARYGNPSKFDDLYQEAWLAIMEASEMGLGEKDMYWHVRNHISRYYNYKDRVVPLPARGGQSDLIEKHEISNDIPDHIATTGDHAADFEWKSEIEHMKKNVANLSQHDKEVLHDLYWSGLTYREMSAKRGYSHTWWQKYHTDLICYLKGLQEEI